jgi:hypothetical protein
MPVSSQAAPNTGSTSSPSVWVRSDTLVRFILEVVVALSELAAIELNR